MTVINNPGAAAAAINFRTDKIETPTPADPKQPAVAETIAQTDPVTVAPGTSILQMAGALLAQDASPASVAQDASNAAAKVAASSSAVLGQASLAALSQGTFLPQDLLDLLEH